MEKPGQAPEKGVAEDRALELGFLVVMVPR